MYTFTYIHVHICESLYVQLIRIYIYVYIYTMLVLSAMVRVESTWMIHTSVAEPWNVKAPRVRGSGS
jgi:hypothetical protein